MAKAYRSSKGPQLTNEPCSPTAGGNETGCSLIRIMTSNPLAANRYRP
jgi:hypothetical protein